MLRGSATFQHNTMNENMNRFSIGVNEHLQQDYFHSMQIRILVGKASSDEKFAQQIGLKVQDALSMINLLGRITKFGFVVSPAARAAAVGTARGALTAGAHITGSYFYVLTSL